MDPIGTPSTIAVAEREHTSHVTVYLRVFFALLVLTLAEYFYAKIFAEASALVLIGGLMAMAVVKAALVGMFFMHLLFEGPWKYLMLIPTGILACIAVFALMPDIGMRDEDATEDVTDLLVAAPAEPEAEAP